MEKDFSVDKRLICDVMSQIKDKMSLFCIIIVLYFRGSMKAYTGYGGLRPILAAVCSRIVKTKFIKRQE